MCDCIYDLLVDCGICSSNRVEDNPEPFILTRVKTKKQVKNKIVKVDKSVQTENIISKIKKKKIKEPGQI